MAKRFVAPLTDSEQQTLTSAYHHGEKRALRRRAHAILLSDKGHTINQITEILQVGRDAVSRWLKQWEASGLDALIDKPCSGRAPVLDANDHQRLQELVAEQPHQIRTLQARFQEETGKTVSTVTLRRALKKKMTSASSGFGTHSRRGVTKRIFAILRAFSRRFTSEKTRASMSSITLMNQAFHNHHRCHMHGALSVNLAR